MRIRTIALAGLAGAAVAYLFDPISGDARRTHLGARIMTVARRGRTVDTARAPRSEDVVTEASAEISDVPAEPGKKAIALGPGATPTDDEAIASRIRTEVFGRPDLQTGRIVIDVVRGVAFLRGEMKDGHAIEEIMDRTRSVPGVRGVHNLILIRMPESLTITRPMRTLGDAWSG
jgi:osmotically-inducible protein OsmY